jgi:hypothetical protein
MVTIHLFVIVVDLLPFAFEHLVISWCFFELAIDCNSSINLFHFHVVRIMLTLGLLRQVDLFFMIIVELCKNLFLILVCVVLP